MKKFFLAVLLISGVFSEAQIVRKYSNEFLSIGAGARGLAMGGAVVSNQNDVYSPMWNPAGLIGVDRDWNYLRTQQVNVDRHQRDLRHGFVALLANKNQPLPVAERVRAGFRRWAGDWCVHRFAAG